MYSVRIGDVPANRRENAPRLARGEDIGATLRIAMHFGAAYIRKERINRTLFMLS
jgi:hypothetical protein